MPKSFKKRITHAELDNNPRFSVAVAGLALIVMPNR
jgi:hypothetical protein